MFQALQLLQFSRCLEAQAHKLRRDALKLVNSTISGTLTTNLWQLLESFFGVDEYAEEEELEDAASLTTTIHTRKQDQEQDSKAKSLSVPKSVAAAEEGVTKEEE